MTVPPIPAKLTKAILFLRGQQDGTRWLSELPATLEHYQQVWGLRLETISDGGAMSACALGTADGFPIVLKVPVDAAAGQLEAELLRYWGPTGAVPAVLNQDPDTGVMVMERILPGDTAWARNGIDDARRYGDLLMRLNAPNPNTPPSLEPLDEVIELRLGWARERFANPDHQHPKAQLEAAREVFNQLRETFDRTRARILHADLQAKNVLNGGSGSYAIDPMGAVGDPNAEAALWIAIQDGPTSIAQRITQLADHPLLDASRLAAWTYVLAIAEYRRYLPASGRRIEEYLDTCNPQALHTDRP